MIRMQDPNSSCDCGKVTKERGTFVTRSKLYETRSSGPRRNGDRIIDEEGDVRINSLKAVDQAHINKMEKTIADDVAPVNNKSFNLRNSTINISKASTNKPHDNMVVTNGNARHSPTDALDDNINVSDEIKLDSLDCKCVRWNKNCDESNKLCNKNVPQVEDESERELREDKQNGDYERRDNGDHCVTRSNHMKKCSRGDLNGSNGVENGLEKDGGEILANGHTNGRENEYNGNDDMDLEHGKEVDTGNEDPEINLSSERKKRKSKFEEIFDSYAEFGCNSDKRRSRKPPESYSPEPARRIKLEHLFDEKINGCQGSNMVSVSVSPSPKVNRSVKKMKPIRKYKPKGPIFHYLDLYIKNKDIDNKDNVIKEKEDVSKEQLTEQVVEDKSTLPGDTSPHTLKRSVREKTPVPEVDNVHDTNLKSPIPTSIETDIHDPVQTLDNGSVNCIDSAPLLVDCVDSDLTSYFPDFTNGNLLLTTSNNKLTKTKKVKPKPLALDAEIQSILGYRRDKGKHEFLVLFHNGTSNWVVQDHNISISTSYEDFFQHSEHELSTINRLAYFISEYSNRVDEEKHVHATSNGPKVSLTKESCDKPSPANSTSLSVLDHKKPVDTHKESCNGSTEQAVNPKLPTHSTDNADDIDEISIDCVQSNLNNSIKTSPFYTGYNDTMYNSDLNDLCYYVMSSRHIKLYPFETTKEVVFKKDDEFMHIYLKNTRKSQDRSSRIDGQINMRSCEKLIYKLEDCAVDDTCEVVVISGIEEYFALKDVFDKLVKKPSSTEGKSYEQDISMLRYLIQTIRNFTKPICAVIKKTASGLPASMLSLFDMVFDERGGNFPKKEKKSKKRGRPSLSHKKSNESFPNITRGNDENGSENFQAYLFPRLMGLTESNESRIMGEGKKLISDDILSGTYRTKRTFSVQLRKSLRNMKSNTKVPPKIPTRKSSRSEGEQEEVDESVEVEECAQAKQTSDSLQSNINNLEMEVQRERELTKRSMDELQSILLTMEPP